jgi:hypothetical protein
MAIKAIRVEVTADHIEEAYRQSATSHTPETCCPIALALKDKRPELEWHVLPDFKDDGEVCGYDEDDEQVECYMLSRRANKEAMRFDEHGSFEAGAYVLKAC